MEGYNRAYGESFDCCQKLQHVVLKASVVSIKSHGDRGHGHYPPPLFKAIHDCKTGQESCRHHDGSKGRLCSLFLNSKLVDLYLLFSRQWRLLHEIGSRKYDYYLNPIKFIEQCLVGYMGAMVRPTSGSSYTKIPSTQL